MRKWSSPYHPLKGDGDLTREEGAAITSGKYTLLWEAKAGLAAARYLDQQRESRAKRKR